MVLHQNDSRRLDTHTPADSDAVVSISVTTSGEGAAVAVHGVVDRDVLATLRRVLDGLPDADIQQATVDLRDAIVNDEDSASTRALLERRARGSDLQVTVVW